MKVLILLAAMGLTACTTASPPPKMRPATAPHLSAAERSAKVRADFQAATPCPATGQKTGPCPGWIADHKWPLCAGGKDEGREHDVADQGLELREGPRGTGLLRMQKG